MRRWAAALLLSAALAASGCNGAAQVGDLSGELRQARADLEACRKRQADLSAALSEKEEVVSRLRGLGEKRLEKLHHVARIELGRYTGGVDMDGRFGDDAVKVYLHPVDRDGSTIKAAGEATVQLYDLAAPAGEQLLGEYKWPAEELSRQWSSGLFTYHYSFVCPWRSGPPEHADVTVRVAFVDYLTGRQFTAQKVCKVKLPSAATTRPAGG
jgi:hypothetical protein